MTKAFRSFTFRVLFKNEDWLPTRAAFARMREDFPTMRVEVIADYAKGKSLATATFPATADGEREGMAAARRGFEGEWK